LPVCADSIANDSSKRVTPRRWPKSENDSSERRLGGAGEIGAAARDRAEIGHRARGAPTIVEVAKCFQRRLVQARRLVPHFLVAIGRLRVAF